MREFKNPSIFQKFIYFFTVRATYLYFKIFFRLELHGIENIPKKGGVLLASNHVSLADPPLIGSSVPRMIHFFAKEELFRIPVLGWYIRQLNAFPVRRFEHDIGAFRRAQILLRNGEAVVLFPEGRRSKNGELGEPKAGVSMLAYKAKVPVVPIYIQNSNRMKTFKKIVIYFGEPLTPVKTEDEKKEYFPFSKRVLEAVAALKSKCYNEKN